MGSVEDLGGTLAGVINRANEETIAELRVEVERTTTAAEAAIDHANLRRMDAEAKVAAVEALADVWDKPRASGGGEYGGFYAGALRSALASEGQLPL